MSSNTTSNGESDLIAGLPSAIFVLIISMAILLCFCASFFPIIYFGRYCERRRKRLAFEAEEEKRYGKSKKHFFGRFKRGRSDTADPWVERKDPETHRIYYENSMTGMFLVFQILFFFKFCC